MAQPIRFLAADTETTGTDPRRDRIVELFILEVDDRLQPGPASLWRFNPGYPIPPSATRVHGISDEDVRDAQQFRQVAGRIQALLSGSTLIAFNGLRFDLPILHEELVRAGQAGLAPNQSVIDPYRLFTEDHPRTLSGAVRHYLGREHDGAHSAEADVRAMLDVLRVQWARRHNKAPHLADLRHNDGREWLDPGRCFYRDQGIVRLGFGKHKNEPAQQFPGYLRWIASSDFGDHTKQIAHSLLSGAPA